MPHSSSTPAGWYGFPNVDWILTILAIEFSQFGIQFVLTQIVKRVNSTTDESSGGWKGIQRSLSEESGSLFNYTSEFR